jgi:hypothetical protein
MSLESCFGGFAGSKFAPAAMGGKRSSVVAIAAVPWYAIKLPGSDP